MSKPKGCMRAYPDICATCEGPQPGEECIERKAPAPAQSREEEARYSCYITAGEYPDRISVKPPIEVFARGLVKMGDHVDLIFDAALRAHKSPQAAEELYDLALHAFIDCPRNHDGDIQHLVATGNRLGIKPAHERHGAAAPQPSRVDPCTGCKHIGPEACSVCPETRPSSQGEDALPAIAESAYFYIVGQIAKAEGSGKLHISKEEIEDAVAPALRGRLASADEEIRRLNRLVDAEAGLRRLAAEDKVEAWAKVRELEGRLASAQSSAQGEEAREMREAGEKMLHELRRVNKVLFIPGYTSDTIMSGDIEEAIRLGSAALERKETI